MKLPSLRSFAFALLVVAASLPGTASAQTATVIDHVPYTISTRGLYVLNNDLSTSQRREAGKRTWLTPTSLALSARSPSCRGRSWSNLPHHQATGC